MQFLTPPVTYRRRYHQLNLKQVNNIKMKKLNLIFLLLLISYFDCFSENSIQINWKVGETKQVTVTSKGQQFENGITLIDTSVISYLDLTDLEFKNHVIKLLCVSIKL